MFSRLCLPPINISFKKYLSRITIILVMFPFLISSHTSAQGLPPGIMVCQTPTFWCAVPAPDFPTGTPCWCNTPRGPVNGLGINPRQVIQQTPTQRPRGGSKEPTRNDEEVIDLGGKADDCLNGLGNCSGSFKSLVTERAKMSNSDRTNPGQESPSGTIPADFREGVRKLADAALRGESAFDSLRVTGGRIRDSVNVTIATGARCSMSKRGAKRIICNLTNNLSQAQAIKSFEESRAWLTSTLGPQGWAGGRDDLGTDEIRRWRYQKSGSRAEISLSADKDDSNYSTYVLFRAAD